jgi:hypothetical protein
VRCPSSEDPRLSDRTARVPEVQQISCAGTATNGGFRLRFRGYSTVLLPYDVRLLRRFTPAVRGVPTLDEALATLPSLPSVLVTVNGYSDADDAADTLAAADRILCGGGTATVLVTMLLPQGDQPLLEVIDEGLTGGVVTVAQIQSGTRQPDLCSARGVCDFSTGRCDCQPQYGSSDGDFAPGAVGDCANLNALYKFGNASAHART